MSTARNTPTSMKANPPSSLDWDKISLDGLRPGACSSNALQSALWSKHCEDEEYISSTSFGDLNVGVPYSFAKVQSEKIVSVSGKILKEDNTILAEVGWPWEKAKTSLGWDGKSDLVSPDGNLSLLLVLGLKGIVEAIQLEAR